MRKVIQKIHLWLSVPFGIIIFLTCFSGAMLVFEPEIHELCNHDIYYVKEVKEEAIPLETLMQGVSATLPDSVEITGVTISDDASRTYQVSLSKPRRASMYVDQYSGQITGKYERGAFFQQMFYIHRWLLDGGNPKEGGIFHGKLIVGISTLVFVIILITGIIVWIYRARKSFKRSLRISTKFGKTIFFKNLHVAGGMYIVVFVLAMAITGLTWSFDWWRTGFYKVFGVEQTEWHPGGGEGRGNRGGHGEGRGEHKGGRGEGGDWHGRGEGRGGHGDWHADGNTGATQHSEPAKDQAKEAPQANDAEKVVAEKSAEIADAEPAEHKHHEHGEGGEWHGHGEGGEWHGHGEGRGGRYHKDEAVATTDSTSPQSEAVAEPKAQEERPHHEWHKHDKPADAAKYHKAKEVAMDSVATEEPADSTEVAVYVPFANWQTAYNEVKAQNQDAPSITVSEGTVQVSLGSWGNTRASDTYNFDTTTGKITTTQKYADGEAGDKMRGWIYAVHTGAWGGIITRIIAFLAALFGASLPLTGYYIWIKRLRNKKK